MKLVHHNKAHAEEKDWLQIAVHHDREGEFEDAVKAYRKFLSIHPHDVDVYNKMMRIYRDMKEYEKELKIINEAIKVFEKRQKELKPAYNKSITTLSKKLLKATGLADEKGNNIYQPPELIRWNKRKQTVLKRLGK